MKIKVRDLVFSLVIVSTVAPCWAADAAAPASPATLGFTDESQLGSAVVSGNSNSQTINAEQSNSYSWDRNVAKFSARYLNTSANGVESARSWDGSLRFERVVAPEVNIFAAHTVESDIYSGYVQRNSFDLGAKYFFTQSDDTKWSAEFGYRYFYTHYVQPSPDSVDNAARIYSEFFQTLGKNSSFKFYAEYVQSLTNTQTYLINSEPSLSVMLNNVLSIKIAYLVKYTNAVYSNYNPKNLTTGLDTIFTTSLVAKF